VFDASVVITLALSTPSTDDSPVATRSRSLAATWSGETKAE